jgi:hypothetical protein
MRILICMHEAHTTPTAQERGKEKERQRMMIYASSVVGASSCTIRFMLYTHMHSTPHTLTVVITCANLSLSLSSPPPLALLSLLFPMYFPRVHGLSVAKLIKKKREQVGDVAPQKPVTIVLIDDRKCDAWGNCQVCLSLSLSLSLSISLSLVVCVCVCVLCVCVCARAPHPHSPQYHPHPHSPQYHLHPPPSLSPTSRPCPMPISVAHLLCASGDDKRFL